MEELDVLCRRAQALLGTKYCSLWPESIHMDDENVAFMVELVLCVVLPGNPTASSPSVR